MQHKDENGKEIPYGVTDCIQRMSKTSWRNLEKTEAVYIALSSALTLFTMIGTL